MSQRRSERGFTLVETMVSFGVLVIAVVGVAQMQIVASGINATSRNLTRASQVALELGQVFQVLPYDHPALAAASTLTGETAQPRQVRETGEQLSAPMQFALGDYDGAEERRAARLAPLLGAISLEEGFRAYWSVVQEDANGDRVPEAKLVSVLVRWRSGERWNNFQVHQARFNPAALTPQ